MSIQRPEAGHLMKEAAELFKRLAARHRQLAGGLQNDEVRAALLRLADECDEKAQELERCVTEQGPKAAMLRRP